MTGVVRKAALLAVLGLVVASSAMAGIPYSATSTVPAFFDVYACNNYPDPLSAVNPKYGFVNRVVVRDIDGLPVPNCPVSLTFCPDVKLYDAVPGHPEQIVVCDPVTGKTTITAIAGPDGVAQFYLVGATNHVAAGNPVGTGAGCVTIVACGISFGTATATVFDQNGVAGIRGTDPGDLPCWLSDFGKQGQPGYGYKGRSDYNHANGIDPGDVSVWLFVYGLANSSQSCGTLCGGPLAP
jgi:hypothetical protein